MAINIDVINVIEYKYCMIIVIKIKLFSKKKKKIVQIQSCFRYTSNRVDFKIKIFCSIENISNSSSNLEKNMTTG